jgi:hypothetical protein
MHISVAATEAREDTYISRNMTGRLEVESSCRRCCELKFVRLTFSRYETKSLSIDESLAVRAPFSGSFSTH